MIRTAKKTEVKIEMQGRVHDLYVIKQAEIESAYLGLTVNE